MNVKAIRNKTVDLLTKNNIPVHSYLPYIDNIKLRDKVEVCKRIIILYSLAGLANGASGEYLKRWLIDEDAWNFFSKEEKKIFEKIDLDNKCLNELSWMQESLYTLCWAGSLADVIQWPSDESDLSIVFDSIPPEKNLDDFFKSFTLRSVGEIAEMLDLYYCLHAALVHPEIWGSYESDCNINIELVLERRQALEWLCSESILWNEVELNT